MKHVRPCDWAIDMQVVNSHKLPLDVSGIFKEDTPFLMGPRHEARDCGKAPVRAGDCGMLKEQDKVELQFSSCK
ncbi:unnamed protein product [Boreogadus saida]